MKEFHTYRDHSIAITDETPLGFSEGTWIGYRMQSGWQIFCSHGEQMICGINVSPPLPQTQEEALARLKLAIDEDIADLVAAAAGIRLREPETTAPQPNQATNSVVPRWRSPDVEIPVLMLLDLHNALPSTASMRQEVIKFVQDCAARKDKAHWARGVMKRDDGTLYFDEAAYSRAVHRGKQETYQKSASDALEKLQQYLLSVISNMHEESEYAKELDGAGQPLVAPPDYSAGLAHLKEKLEMLGAVTNHFRGDPIVLEAWELVRRLQLPGPDTKRDT